MKVLNLLKFVTLSAIIFLVICLQGLSAANAQSSDKVQPLPEACESLDRTRLYEPATNNQNELIIDYAVADLAIAHATSKDLIVRRGDKKLSKVLSFIAHSSRIKALADLENNEFIKLLKARQNLKLGRTKIIAELSNLFSITSNDLFPLTETFSNCAVCAHFSCQDDPDDRSCVAVDNSQAHTQIQQILNGYRNTLRSAIKLAISIRNHSNSKQNKLIKLIEEWNQDLENTVLTVPESLAMSYDCW